MASELSSVSFCTQLIEDYLSIKLSLKIFTIRCKVNNRSSISIERVEVCLALQMYLCMFSPSPCRFYRMELRTWIMTIGVNRTLTLTENGRFMQVIYGWMVKDLMLSWSRFPVEKKENG